MSKLVYLQTLQISNRRVDYCINKKSSNGLCSPDKRGHATLNSTTSAAEENIKQFLEKIPKFKSHYSESNKLYFSPDLTKSKLYELYKEAQQDANLRSVSKPIFLQHFHMYNIGIYLPKSDTCQFCDLQYITASS